MKKTIIPFCFLFVLVCLGVAPSCFAADSEADSVVIVVNGNDPDSLAIGEYYAERRGIPAGNIIRLETSTEETISLEEYVRTISNPLLDALMDREWVSGVKAAEKDRYGRERLSVAVHEIRYLVTVRGIPLRIRNAPELIDDDLKKVPQQFQYNRAAVDSELALLPAPPDLTMTAFQPNPYFERKPVSAADANRVIKVSRLDGPSKADVIRLIDRTLEAEADGLAGRAYIDLGGPHSRGDEWIGAAGDLARGAYFDTEVETTKRPRGYRDRLDAPALYFGWYRRHAYGPWLAPRWTVPPGAIAYHLHSFSATTVRSETKGWVGPFVAQGYAATFGYVYEPYLEFTVRPQLFLEHLLEGESFGDAIAYSNPVLSWQTVAVGDPLYRPFQKGLDAQLEAAGEGAFDAYLGLRQLNRLEAEASADEALAYARQLFLDHPSLAVAYRLSEMYEARGQDSKALEVLKVVRYLSRYNDDEVALVKEIANRLLKLGDSELAFKVYDKLINESDLPKQLRITLLEDGAEVAAAAGEDALATRWEMQAKTLQ